MTVTLPADVLGRYRRFTLYDSPYAAHDAGRAIDLYPDPETAPSPVTGTVRDVRHVRAPPKPYAADEDVLLVVDTGEHLVRIMHVDPTVDPGDSVAVGEDLGDLIRAGFFAPWVPNHLHVGFRPRDADAYRASGSLPLALGVDVEPLSWDGTGTVVETDETWARLDRPAHPDPEEYFVGFTADLAGGEPVLDGGLPHYEYGGLVGDGHPDTGASGRVALAGSPVGTVEGRHVAWDDLTVLANGEPVTGLALFCARDRLGAKLVGEAVDLSVGETVTVTVRRD